MRFNKPYVAIFGVLFASTFVSLSAQSAKRYDAATKQWIETTNATSSPLRSNTRRTVSTFGQYRRGSILIDTEQRALFHFRKSGKATRYSIGVGKEGFAWSGKQKISRKEEWPSWTPPVEMRQREAKNGRILPKRMEGGPENPLGARALYLGSTLYRIHGTNQPETIGKAVSSGCIRMVNEDIIHLFDRVTIGTRVVVK